MKRALKYLGVLSSILFLSICLYYFFTLYNATLYTRGIIIPDLGKNQWRTPNGTARKFEIFSSELSRRQKDILIKVQDPGFYHHKGIDLSTPGAGWTTITQAIVKKLYFENFKPGIAKIKQTLIARFVVNDLIAKEDQITLFINTMAFGRVNGKPTLGLASAAEVYYRQPVQNLTEDHYISLIAIIVMPETFHLLNHPEWNKDRTNRIKALMAGKYTPTGLMDQFYGKLPQEVIDNGLPPGSYYGDALKPGDSSEKKEEKPFGPSSNPGSK